MTYRVMPVRDGLSVEPDSEGVLMTQTSSTDGSVSEVYIQIDQLETINRWLKEIQQGYLSG
jgi:hypothetical protein